MKCLYCSEAAVKSGLCKKHFILKSEEIFLDNTSCDSNMGILKWLKAMYPEHYRNNFNRGHIEVYLALLRLYDPRYINKQHRLRALIAFRGFAKSKIIFGIISYLLAHNGMKMKIKSEDGIVFETEIKERHIVIFSETYTMAEEFVSNIRDEFSTNLNLRYFYRYKIEDAIDDITGQWTKRAFKMNGCYVVGLGAKQQARGKIRGAYRPTFAFFDDIYSENNTITFESRQSIKRWFYNSAINSVDDLLGKVFLVGTIINEDTVLVECERSTSWKTMKYVPMDINEFKSAASKHLKIDYDRKIVEFPYDKEEMSEFERIEAQRNYFKEAEKEYNLLWSERIGLYELMLKYREAIETENLSGFYQEYFHEVTPVELKKFSPGYFKRINDYEIKKEFGHVWFIEKGGLTAKVMNVEIGVDIAGGKAEGDNSAITVVGALADGRIIILAQSYGKYQIRDSGFKRGYIDETIRMAKEYGAIKIKVGLGGGHEGAIIEEFRRVAMENKLYIPIIPRPQNRSEGEKYERIERTLLPYYENGRIYHGCDLTQLERELEFLRKSKSDDCADSLETAIWNLQKPVDVKYEFFKPKDAKRSDLRLMKEEDWLIL